MHLGHGIGRIPRTWNPSQPTIVFPPAIKPDYRSREYLPLRSHASIVCAPALHPHRIDLIGMVIVARWANGMMALTGSVIPKQQPKPEAVYHPA